MSFYFSVMSVALLIGLLGGIVGGLVAVFVVPWRIILSPQEPRSSHD